MSEANANGDIEAGSGGGGGAVEEGRRKPMSYVAETTPMERVAGGVGVTAFSSSLVAIILESSIIVKVAGGLSMAIGPYAWWQQTRLTDIAALKETHEAVQREVDTLQAENERLKKSVQDLGDTVTRLEDVEEALDVITQTQGQSVEAFAEQVKDNRKILQDMQKNLKANVLQNLLSVIIRSDTDGDFMIDDEETEELVRRMQSINGVTLNEQRFRDAIKNAGGSLRAVMDVVKNLLSDNVSKEDSIFVIDEED